MGLDHGIMKYVNTGMAAYTPQEGEITLRYERFNKPDEFVKFPKDRINTFIYDGVVWRKENHFHKWFVANVQDNDDNCEEYWVSDEMIEELISDCKSVLEDHDRAPVLLPTTSGFFFGGTDYDEGYFQSLEDAVKELRDLLDNEPFGTLYYWSSW